MKKLIDTVNFDYPTCGGYEVWEKSPHLFSVRQFSNYQGQKTHRYYMVKETTAEDALAMVREGRAEDCVTRKGREVQ